jgi:hypothetical protein
MGFFTRKSDLKLKEEAMLLKEKRMKLEERKRIQDDIASEKKLIKQAKGKNLFERLADKAREADKQIQKFQPKKSKPIKKKTDLGDSFFR